jgi:hypothetical protein
VKPFVWSVVAAAVILSGCASDSGVITQAPVNNDGPNSEYKALKDGDTAPATEGGSATSPNPGGGTTQNPGGNNRPGMGAPTNPQGGGNRGGQTGQPGQPGQPGPNGEGTNAEQPNGGGEGRRPGPGGPGGQGGPGGGPGGQRGQIPPEWADVERDTNISLKDIPAPIYPGATLSEEEGAIWKMTFPQGGVRYRAVLLTSDARDKVMEFYNSKLVDVRANDRGLNGMAPNDFRVMLNVMDGPGGKQRINLMVMKGEGPPRRGGDGQPNSGRRPPGGPGGGA